MTALSALGTRVFLLTAGCAALLTALGSAGCATTRWAAPIGEFKQSVDESVAVIGAYYEELNAYERRVYLESAYLDPTQEILWTDAAGNPTPLSGRVFSAASIEARLDALRLVSAYARRLADLAGSEAPARYATNADVLGAGLTNLTRTFEALSAKDVSARAYVGPVASLIGAIGRVVLEQRRDAAIALAVRAGDQPVTDILNQFETDLALVVAPLRSAGERLQLADLVNDYNTTRTSMSAEARRRKGDRIQAAAESYFKAVAFNPASVVAGLREAHHALIKYATSPRRPADLAEFATGLDVFASRVDAAAAAVRSLRAVR